MQIDGGVRIVAFVVDVDDTDAHRSGLDSSSDWWSSELKKIEYLDTHCPCVAYRTRGGYRLVWRLEKPFAIQGKAEARVWKASYLQALAHLDARYGIVCSTSITNTH